MARGGARPGAGRKRDPNSFRGFCRDFADDPTIFARAKKAALRALDAGDVDPYIRLSEHGHGRPPQALHIDATLRGDEANPLYVARFADAPPSSDALPSAPVPLPAPIARGHAS